MDNSEILSVEVSAVRVRSQKDTAFNFYHIFKRYATDGWTTHDQHIGRPSSKLSLPNPFSAEPFDHWNGSSSTGKSHPISNGELKTHLELSGTYDAVKLLAAGNVYLRSPAMAVIQFPGDLMTARAARNQSVVVIVDSITFRTGNEALDERIDMAFPKLDKGKKVGRDISKSASLEQSDCFIEEIEGVKIFIAPVAFAKRDSYINAGLARLVGSDGDRYHIKPQFTTWDSPDSYSSAPPMKWEDIPGANKHLKPVGLEYAVEKFMQGGKDFALALKSALPLFASVCEAPLSSWAPVWVAGTGGGGTDYSCQTTLARVFYAFLFNKGWRLIGKSEGCEDTDLCYALKTTQHTRSVVKVIGGNGDGKLARMALSKILASPVRVGDVDLSDSINITFKELGKRLKSAGAKLSLPNSKVPPALNTRAGGRWFSQLPIIKEFEIPDAPEEVTGLVSMECVTITRVPVSVPVTAALKIPSHASSSSRFSTLIRDAAAVQLDTRSNLIDSTVRGIFSEKKLPFEGISSVSPRSFKKGPISEAPEQEAPTPISEVLEGLI